MPIFDPRIFDAGSLGFSLFDVGGLGIPAPMIARHVQAQQHPVTRFTLQWMKQRDDVIAIIEGLRTYLELKLKVRSI